MNTAHYAPESIICAMKYNYISCCVPVQVFISLSTLTDVPSSPLQPVLASVPAAVASPLPGDGEDQDVQLEICPCFSAGCVLEPSRLIPEH